MRQVPSDRSDQFADKGEEPLAPLLADYHAALLAGAAEPQTADHVADASHLDLDAPSQAELARAQRVIRSLVRARKLTASGATPSAGGSAATAEALPSWLALAEMGGDGTPLKQLGRFEMVRELGRGGLGVVFLAYDPVLRRQVALKVPRPEVLLSREASARFDREAQAVARLLHPNLVPVYEIGQVGVIKYIAAAYCTGPNLANWLREQSVPPSPRTAAALVAQLADAVQYAHTRGVLHRDIKPSNVVLEPIGDELDLTVDKSRAPSLRFTPKLVDFGLAKLEGSNDGETRTGTMLGTPGYMAPEQIEGRLADIAPATDVYGLGTVLYELLTGRCPFAATSVAHSARLVLSEEPTRPRQWNRSVPADLEAICLKCLEKSPSRRYASAAELAADLRRFQTGEPTRARPAGMLRRVVKWSRRKPWAAALVFVVALSTAILSAGGAFYTWHLRDSLARESRLKNDLARTAADLQTAIYPLELARLQKMWERGDSAGVRQALAKLRESRPGAATDFAIAYLDRVTNRPPHQVLEHPGEVYGLAYSPDGTLLASCGENKEIRLWNVADGRLLRTFTGHTAEVNCVAFSPDGASLYAVDDSGRIVRWQVADGAILDERPATNQRLWNVALSPDGQRLAVVGDYAVSAGTLTDNSLLIVHGTSSGLPVLFEHRAEAGHRAAEFSADGRLWVTGGYRKTLSVFEPAEAASQVLDPTTEPGWTLAATRDGALVAVATPGGNILVLDTSIRKLIHQWRSQFNEIEALQFAPDGTYLVSVGRDGVVRFWEPRTGSLLDALDTGADRLWAVRISPDGSRIAAAGSSGKIVAWLRSEFPWKRFVKPRGGADLATSICPARKFVAHTSSPGQVELIDAETGVATMSFPVRFAEVGSDIKFSLDGELLGSTQVYGPQASVELRRLTPTDSAKRQRSILDFDPGEHQRRNCLAFSPDGKRAYLLARDDRIRIVDGKSLEVIGETSNPAYRDAIMILDATDTELIVISRQADVSVVDLTSNRVTQAFSLPKGATFFNCAQAGKVLATTGRSAGVWHIASGRQERTLECDGRILAAECLPSGGEVAILHDPATITLFDLRTGGRTIHLAAPVGANSLSFSLDSSALIAAGTTDSQLDVRVWDSKPANSR
ncbi:MAG: protein kinase [Pirellulales bacterium]|nr:protein kinase [Pirellulales bacterium]